MWQLLSPHLSHLHWSIIQSSLNLREVTSLVTGIRASWELLLSSYVPLPVATLHLMSDLCPRWHQEALGDPHSGSLCQAMTTPEQSSKIKAIFCLGVTLHFKKTDCKLSPAPNRTIPDYLLIWDTTSIVLKSQHKLGRWRLLNVCGNFSKLHLFRLWGTMLLPLPAPLPVSPFCTTCSMCHLPTVQLY